VPNQRPARSVKPAPTMMKTTTRSAEPMKTGGSIRAVTRDQDSSGSIRRRRAGKGLSGGLSCTAR